MDTQRPSLFRIAITDYLTFLAWISTVILWAGYFFTAPGTSSSLLYISVAVTVIAIPVIIWRILYILRIFKIGEGISAKILGISFYRSRGRVDFTYIYKGSEYISNNLLLVSGRVRELTAGKEIDILLNPENPKQAVIRGIFS